MSLADTSEYKAKHRSMSGAFYIAISSSGKTTGFDPVIRWFESNYRSHAQNMIRVVKTVKLW